MSVGIINDSTLYDIADAIREKTETTTEYLPSEMPDAIRNIETGVTLPKLDNPADVSKVLSGYEFINGNGEKKTGNISTKTSSDVKVSGKTVTVPSGYYASQVTKLVSTVTQATPSISISSGGLITASATQSAGYVSSGTKSATKQLTTQGAQEITPGTSNKTIASGRYLTGTQTIKGDSNLKPENIKKDVSIFGVTGSYEGTSSGQYCWKKYSVKKDYELTQENLGTTEPDESISASYVSYTITDDGYFKLNSGTSTGIGTSFHLPYGATNGKTKYIYSRKWNFNGSTSYYTYNKFTLSDTYTETKSDLLGYAVSDNSNIYPNDGTSDDGYWYVLVSESD